jgi:putative oxidoreductase
MGAVSSFIASKPFRSRTQRRVLGRIVTTCPDPALMVVRLVLGAIMSAHGAQELLGGFGGEGLEATLSLFSEKLGIPAGLALLVILAEFLVGIGLVVGCLGRVAAAGILMAMTGALSMVHARYGFFMNWSGKQEGEGVEVHLQVLALSPVILLRGSGPYSVDPRPAQTLR